MGIYSDYLDRGFNFHQLNIERKKQLKRISELRDNREILVYAADFQKGKAPISISYEDLVPINDQVSNLSGTKLDLILETPGGLGEVAEDIVKLLRSKFDDIAVIIPGWAKSAGTLIAMSCDDILMEPISALGPIDAQISREGKVFSADALITGFEEIKQEVEKKKVLNKAYIPVLQRISPGELKDANNALDFGKKLVREWLVKYKFKDWNIHSSNGKPVTAEEKKQRAHEIADCLCDHGKWLTHGRSIKINDLEEMKLKITNYSLNNELADAIRRYYSLLKITFDSSNVYKVYETVNSQIFKSYNEPIPEKIQIPKRASNVINIAINCPKCGRQYNLQAGNKDVLPGYIPFPNDNKIICEQCGNTIDLEQIRKDIEAQTGIKII